MSLADEAELAVWYRQAGATGGWFELDRTWSIGDRTGAGVGTVFVDGDLFAAPDYWIRDAAGSPVLGLTHAAGVIQRPVHRIVWADGNPVGVFQEAAVQWQDRVIGKWKVDARREGTSSVFGGAWLWAADDTPVAEVTDVDAGPQGAYFALRRVAAEVDEALRWSTVAFVLVAAEYVRRVEAEAAAARRRRRNRRFD